MSRPNTRLVLPLAMLAAIAVSHCGDGTPTEPEQEQSGLPVPSFSIQDAAHGGGNAHFYWLPPLVPNPSYSGGFDGSLSPVVRICDLAVAGCAVTPVAEFTMTTGPGSETVRVVPEDEHYIVNWHTDESEVGPGPTYRISVLVAGTELGFAEMQFGTTGKEVKNLTTGAIIGLKDGRTLPIKFRIEQGAVFVVGTAGGTITAEGGAVVLVVPSGALPADVGITVDATADFPADVGLITGAVFDFQPDGTTFSPPATLTLAYDEANLLVGLPESSLTILTEEGSEWVEIAGSTVDDVANSVTAPIDGFSKFGPAGRVTSVDVSPASSDLEVAETVQFTATPKNGADNPVNRPVNWRSLDPAIASVDNTGLVTAVAPGTVTIEAKSGSAVGSAAVTVGSEWASLSSDGFTCGVTTGGDAFCWGNSFATFPIPGTIQFASVSPGFLHTCGVTAAGDAYCWGDGADGKLGDGLTTSSPTPVPVSGGHSFATVDAAWRHTCGITTFGDAYCWGSNSGGPLGTLPVISSSSTPVLVAGGHTWTKISAGPFHNCGITTVGDTYCWGNNFAGQAGDGTSRNARVVPTLVLGGHTFVDIATGGRFSCAVDASGDAYCWGENNAGQVGDGTLTNRSVPRPVLGGLSFTDVSASGSGNLAASKHACGVTTSGDVYCWGLNALGQLGNGTTIDSRTPVLVDGGLQATAIEVAHSYSCMLTPDGDAYCWGASTSTTPVLVPIP